MRRSFACVALILTSDGHIPIVQDPNRPVPLWKYPGGTNDSEETPEECVRREVLEETGINLDLLHPTPLTICAEEVRDGGHTFYVYFVELPATHGQIHLLERGDEGELVRWSTPKEIIPMRDFLEGQRELTRDLLLEIHYS